MYPALVRGPHSLYLRARVPHTPPPHPPISVRAVSFILSPRRAFQRYISLNLTHTHTRALSSPPFFTHPVDPTPDAQVRVRLFDRSGREVSCFAPNAVADAGVGAIQGEGGEGVVGGQEGEGAGGEPDAKRPRVE